MGTRDGSDDGATVVGDSVGFPVGDLLVSRLGGTEGTVVGKRLGSLPRVGTAVGVLEGDALG